MNGNPSRPGPGTVREDRFGKWATCHGCGTYYMVNREGLILPHDKPLGGGPCPHRWVAADLNAAVNRDDSLNEEERHVHNRVYRWLSSCRGFQSVSDGTREPCYHPVCMRRMDDGYRWSINGWKKETRS